MIIVSIIDSPILRNMKSDRWTVSVRVVVVNKYRTWDFWRIRSRNIYLSLFIHLGLRQPLSIRIYPLSNRNRSSLFPPNWPRKLSCRLRCFASGKTLRKSGNDSRLQRETRPIPNPDARTAEPRLFSSERQQRIAHNLRSAPPPTRTTRFALEKVCAYIIVHRTTRRFGDPSY